MSSVSRHSTMGRFVLFAVIVSATFTTAPRGARADAAKALGCKPLSASYGASAIWDGRAAYIFGGGDGVAKDTIDRFDPVTNTMVTLAVKLPSARSSTSAIWDGANAYIFGGGSSSGWLNQIVRFTPATNTVTLMSATLPSGRSGASAIWDGTNAYIFGGQGSAVYFDEIVRYNPATNTVTTMSAKLPAARWGPSAVFDGSNGENAYIVGGIESTGPTTFGDSKQIVRYNTRTNVVTVMSAQLPEGRSGASAAYDGRFAYIYGGFSGANYLDSIVRYDPIANIVMTTTEKLPTTRAGTSAVSDGFVSYIFGGFNGTRFDEVLRHDNLRHYVAATCAALPVAIQDTSAVYSGNDHYVFGGFDGGYRNAIMKYNSVTNGVTTMTSTLPAAASLTSAAWDGARAYIFGGFNGTNPLDAITRFDSAIGTTQPMSATLPVAASCTSAIWDGSNAYIFGGSDGTAPLNTITKYDPVTNTVSTMPSRLPIAVSCTSAIWDGANAYIFGGFDGASAVNTIVKYNPGTDTAMLLPVTLPAAAQRTSAIWTGNNAYIFGGSNTPGYSDAVMKFNPASTAVTTMSARLPFGRDGTSATWDGTNAYIFGGASPTGSTFEIVRYSLPPGAPVQLNAAAGPGRGQISLGWNPPSADSYDSPITGYNIYRGCQGSSTLIATVGNVTVYGDTGLPDDATYCYTVAAINASGSGAVSNQVSATTFAMPSSPLTLAAVGGHRQIVLTWMPPASSGGAPITGYKIYRAATSGNEAYLATVGNVTTYTDAGLHSSLTYFYYVTAITVAGESEPSNEASATTDALVPGVRRLVISPASATILAGNAQQYTAEAFNEDGDPMGDWTSQTSFSIVPNGACSGSTCTATVAGAHTVTGTSGGVSGTASLQVDPQTTIVTLSISPSNATITAGGTQAYTAQAFDQYGNTLGDRTSQTTFAISPDGSCAASNCGSTVAGTHSVTGTLSGKTGTATLQIDPEAIPDHLGISPPSASITAGGSKSYTSATYDRYNNFIADQTSATTFAVSPNGSCTGSTCTATVAGTHTVTGTSAGMSATATLQVNAEPIVSTLGISPAMATINAGATQAYSAEAFDQYGNSLGDRTSQTTFTMTPDGSCSGAACTATTAGAHTVSGSSNGKTATASLQVNAVQTIDHLALSPDVAAITAGGSQAYVAQAYDQYNNLIGDRTAQTTFSVAPNGTCSGATCTATVAGQHTVTGTSGGKSATALLNVSAKQVVETLTISPVSATINAGDAQAYTAQAFDEYGNSLGDRTSQTTFTIAPNGSCTAASCRATTSGAHTVTGASNGKTGTATLQVNAKPIIDSLTISPATATITAGSSQAYTAEAFDQYGNSLGDRTSQTTFTITPDGSCSAAACTVTTAGTHTVTGTSNGKTATASLSVNAKPIVDSLSISPASASITAGSSQAYTAQAFDQYGNSLGDRTSQTTFTITPDGSCTGVTCTTTTAGAHTVTGTSNGKSATASLQVNPEPVVHHLGLTPLSASINAGDGQIYAAKTYDRFGNAIADVTSQTTFAITPDGSCSAATCTTTIAGAHTVTGSSGALTATASLQVNAKPVVDTLSISPATATITAGSAQTYTAQALDEYGNSLGDRTSQTVFTIAANGSCTAASCTASLAGAHTVTGTSGGKTATATLQVDPKPVVDRLGLSPDLSSIVAGGSQAYTSQAFDEYGNSLGDRTSQTVFSISPNGSCVAASCSATVAGQHTVTGTANGTSATAVLNVTAKPIVETLTISPVSASIAAGGSQAYTSQAFDEYGNSLGDRTAQTSFAITPDGSCTAASCTAIVAGLHTVTATSAGKSATATLQVNAKQVVESLVISPASATVTAGGSQAYTAQGFDQYGNSLGDRTSQTVFTISPNGSCSAAACSATTFGAHTVTGTSNGKGATASLQVDPKPVVDHLGLSPDTATIVAGGSQTYTSQAYDEYGNSLGDRTSQTVFAISPNGTCSAASCSATVAGQHTVTGTATGKSATAVLNVTAKPIVDTLTISPASATITAGGSQAYTTQAFDQYGNSLGDRTSQTTFTLVPNGSCAAASCTSTTAGAHTVTGVSNGKSASATLQVDAKPIVDTLTISPASATITAGGSQGYTTQAFDQYGNSLGDRTSQTTFTLAPNGSCTAASCTATTAGAHTVTGVSNGKTATASLQVDANPVVDSLTISPASATITAGGSQAYTTQAFDQYGNSLGDRTSQTTFTLAPNGSCTAASCTATTAGAHTVTGVSNGKTATASLQVNAKPVVESLTISPASATITAGSAQTYTAQAFDQYGNSLGDRTSQTTFTLAPNGSCTAASCTATTAGAHTVTGVIGGKSATASLQVNAKSVVVSLGITPATATITAGASQAYTAQGLDEYGNANGDRTSQTTFTVAPDGSCTAAVCTATIAGPHTVTGISGGKSATATLQVLAAARQTLSLSLAPDTIQADGMAISKAVAHVRDRYGNDVPGEHPALSGSGDAFVPAVMTIENGAYVAAITASKTADDETITVTAGSMTAFAVLHEIAGPVTQIALTASPSRVQSSVPAVLSRTSTIAATAKDQYGNPVRGIAVSFAITTSASGSVAGLPLFPPKLSASGATTDATGRASITYTSGALFGDDVVTAAADAGRASVVIHVFVCNTPCPAPIGPPPVGTAAAAPAPAQVRPPGKQPSD